MKDGEQEVEEGEGERSVGEETMREVCSRGFCDDSGEYYATAAISSELSSSKKLSLVLFATPSGLLSPQSTLLSSQSYDNYQGPGSAKWNCTR